MIVHVRFLAVLGLFLLLRVVMAVHKKVVIMVVRVPVPAVPPWVQRIVGVMVGDVIVIVRVRSGGVGVLGLFSLALRVLVPVGC